MSVLEELAFESEDININEAAVLSYTAIIGDAEGVPVSPQLLIALQYIDKISEDEAVTIMHAVGNAGPKVLFHLTSSLLLPSRALPHLFMQLLSMLSNSTLKILLTTILQLQGTDRSNSQC